MLLVYLHRPYDRRLFRSMEVSLLAVDRRCVCVWCVCVCLSVCVCVVYES